MLILTRKAGETILIGENISITVVEIRGRHVRLGIDAPKGVSIVRTDIEGQKPSEKGEKGN